MTQDNGMDAGALSYREPEERCERLEQEARIHAQEARTQRATVQAIYQLVTGATGEPGDWHGAEPVRELVAERDEMRDQRDTLIDAACLDGAGPRLRAAIDRIGDGAFSRCAPFGMALVPREITAETGHKAGMVGDFHESVLVRCPDCDNDEPDPDCEICDGLIEYEESVTVSWTTIKAIHRRIVEIAEEEQP
ncbi:hypothetical protein EQG41_19705 [Billgrantia azerbaijanica]|nr:hypothetical protein EQG41_19705 [Halomonas azerbaijanica]